MQSNLIAFLITHPVMFSCHSTAFPAHLLIPLSLCASGVVPKDLHRVSIQKSILSHGADSPGSREDVAPICEPIHTAHVHCA